MFFHSYKSILTGILFLFSLPALAINVFTETFPGERTGQSQNALANWNFLYGNVDVGRYMAGTYPGTAIDLAGDFNASIETKNTISLAPGKYTFSFFGQDNSFRNSQMLVEIGTVFSQVYNAGATPQTYTTTFDVTAQTNATIRLTEQGPQDKGGTFVANILVDFMSPLPVSLLNFTARQAAQDVVLEWQTASETNNMGFEIQQSQDGKQWKSIHFTEGKNTTSVLSSYDFTTGNILSDGFYFRLKQLDYNGDFSYSRIVYLKNNSTEDIRVIQKANGHQLEIMGVVNPELSLFDMQGIQLKHLQSQDMNIEDLPNGLYILAINQESNSPKTVRILKQ